jgi:hypothetical protein
LEKKKQKKLAKDSSTTTQFLAESFALVSSLGGPLVDFAQRVKHRASFSFHTHEKKIKDVKNTVS